MVGARCHHRIDGSPRTTVGVRPQVTASVERRLVAGMPHSRLDDLHVGTPGDEERRQVVTEIVVPEVVRQPGTFCGQSGWPARGSKERAGALTGP